MRGLALAIVLVGGVSGCLLHRAGPSDDPAPGGSDDEPGRICGASRDCGGDEVCSRTHGCWPPDQIRTIHASWTLKGAPASTTSCATAPNDLMISFSASNGPRSTELTFVPIACAEGRFTIDLMPMSYDRVAVLRSSGAERQEAAVDSAGNAVLDLPY